MHLRVIIKRNILFGFFLSALIALDIFSIIALSDFSSKYPFDRVLYGNKFKYSFVVLGKSDLYDSTLVKMDNYFLTQNNAKKMIAGNSGYLTRYQIKKKDGTLVSYTAQREFNYDFFSSAVFFIIIANIHILWGLIVWRIRLEYKLSNYYSLFSINLGVILFSLSLNFIYENLIYAVFTSSSVFTALFLFLFADMINARKGNLIKIFSAVLSFALVCFSLYSLFENRSGAIIVLNAVILFLFSVLTVMFLYTFAKHRLSIKKTVQITFLAFCGFILPCAILLWSNMFDIPVTVYVNTSLTMIIPLSLGNSLIRGKGSFKFAVDKTFFGEFSADLFSAFLISFLIVSGFSLYFSGISGSILFPLSLVSVAVIVYLRRKFKKGINTPSLNQDVFISSLRDISMVAAETSELNYKLARIYIEAFRVLSINQLKIYITSERLKNPEKSPFKTYIEYFHTDSFLAKHFEKYRGLIRKDSLFSAPVYEKIDMDFDNGGSYAAVMPVSDGDKLLGVVFLGKKTNGMDFSDNDVHFINSFSFMVYQMVENDIMFTDYIDKISFEQDLDNASFVQMRLFPKQFPEKSGLDIVYYIRPYMKLMGDYFDCFRIAENKTAFVIADVTGHGISAAMIVSVTSMMINSLTKLGMPLSKVFYELNNFLTSRYSGIELITAFAGIYDSSANEISYINAGHCQPALYKRNNEPVFVEERFNMLGVDKNTDFSVKTFSFTKGDSLVLYSDGLTELYDSKRKNIVGNEIFSSISKDRFKSTETLLDYFVSIVDSFPSDMIKDDVTIAVIKCD